MNKSKKIICSIFFTIIILIVVMLVLPENFVLHISGSSLSTVFSVEDKQEELSDSGKQLEYNEKKQEYVLKFGITVDPNAVLVCKTDVDNLQIELKSYLFSVLKLSDDSVNVLVYKTISDDDTGIYQIEIGYDLFKRLETVSKLYYIIKRMILIIVLLVSTILFLSVLFLLDEKKREKYNRIGFVVIKQFGMLILTILAVGLPYAYMYIRENFFEVNLEQFIFYLNTDLTGANISNFQDGIAMITILIGAVFIINIILLFIFIALKNNKKGNHLKRNIVISYMIRLLLSVVAFIVIARYTYKFIDTYEVLDYFVNKDILTTLYEDYYVDASDKEITFPDEKKNLIYIYLESMEITNADVEHGGGERVNYIPNLTELALDNHNFNGTTDHLNGGYVVGNSSWTIAGIVAQTAGVPLNVSKDNNNSYGQDEFLPGITSLGDILESAGYHNYYMIGSKADFGNRDVYFTQHGNYRIYDYNWAVEEKKIPSDYYVWWGFEDYRLFDLAKVQLLEAAEDEEPFNFTMLTADTHFTDGYVCDMCENKYALQYQNVLACSDDRVIEFIDWIKQQDFYENTVIILSGDHLYMDSEYFGNVSYDYNRRTYVTILNSSKEEPKNLRYYSSYDLFPTTLSALGCEIEGDRLGLGTDLYSDEMTLIEIMGEDRLNYQLELRSEYYNEYIMNMYK